MKSLVKDYMETVIVRQSIIILLSAPLPAAMIKLQGSLLDEMTIGVMIILGNLISMMAFAFNKMKYETVFKISHIGAVLSVMGLVIGYLMEVDVVYLIFVFPVMMNGFLFLAGVYSQKFKNIVKDKLKEEFDLGYFENTKTSVTSVCAVLGQGLGILFYYFWDVNALLILVCIEVCKGVFWLVLEMKHYSLIKDIEKM